MSTTLKSSDLKIVNIELNYQDKPMKDTIHKVLYCEGSKSLMFAGFVNVYNVQDDPDSSNVFGFKFAVKLRNDDIELLKSSKIEKAVIDMFNNHETLHGLLVIQCSMLLNNYFRYTDTEE